MESARKAERTTNHTRPFILPVAKEIFKKEGPAMGIDENTIFSRKEACVHYRDNLCIAFYLISDYFYPRSLMESILISAFPFIMHTSQPILVESHSNATIRVSSSITTSNHNHQRADNSSSSVNHNAPQCCHCGWRGAHAPTCPFK
ncbi:unnamed protein product [Somion occarium]|uniref:Uncharacterized protein n=1 Tax=Somion occarium TaxID=3059160 RepID=A0ABP1CG74_9APHY